MTLMRNNLTYEDIFDKIAKYQDKIFPALAKVAEQGSMPELLHTR